MSDEPRLYNNIAALANVARLLALIDLLQNRPSGLPGMGCFFGKTGAGKTTAGIYATNKTDACHIQALPIGGSNYLLEMIVRELGLKPKRRAQDLFEQAAQELAVSNRPLIIDEADQILVTRTIEVVRLLHEASGVPVILMGEELLPQRLQAWERVHGRMRSVMAEPATLEDVGHLAKIYAPNVEIASDLREAVLTASGRSMRYISSNLWSIADYARVRGLSRINRGDWGDTAFHTGEPPALRRNLDVLPARRGRTVA